MDRRIAQWKLGVERVWSAAAPDYGDAARVVDDIARFSDEAVLRRAATQALPILRSATTDDADHVTREAARRRLGVIRDVLLSLATPPFGRRESSPKQLTPQERYRQMLGLPIDGSLSAPEIHQAWKRTAKAAHPDAGGSAREFLELSAARDALIKEVRLVRSV
jgi:hypothetical protein